MLPRHANQRKRYRSAQRLAERMKVLLLVGSLAFETAGCATCQQHPVVCGVTFVGLGAAAMYVAGKHSSEIGYPGRYPDG